MFSVQKHSLFKGVKMNIITSSSQIGMFRNGGEVYCKVCKKAHGIFTKKWDRENGEYLRCDRCDAVSDYLGKSNKNQEGNHVERGAGRVVSISEYLGRCSRRAKIKNYEMTITEDTILGLLDKQDNKCVFSGVSFEDEKWSVDRIDSSIGYTEDNVQLVTIRVNLMKSNMNDYDFIKLCGNIWETSKEALVNDTRPEVEKYDLEKEMLIAVNKLEVLFK